MKKEKKEKGKNLKNMKMVFIVRLGKYVKKKETYKTRQFEKNEIRKI